MVENASPSSASAADTTQLELLTDNELRISRRFQAPAKIVFQAWTQPEFVRRWWAPKSHGVEMIACDADVREGGNYRYVMQPTSGGELAFSGVYREVSPYTRLVYTQCFEPMREAGDVIVTVTFQEKEGATLLESVETYPSKEAMEGAIAAGMESGMRETMKQLDAILEELV